MDTQHQAGIEARLKERSRLVEEGEMEPREAFGKVDDWTIQLGEKRAFLHPQLKEWMWYDRLHKEWVFAECGIGEAILLIVDSLAGIKKLPSPGPVADWCVYRSGKDFSGPVPLEDLKKIIESGEGSDHLRIWTTRGTAWRSAADFSKLDLAET